MAIDGRLWWAIAAGPVLLAVPALHRLAIDNWAHDDQGYGPVLLIASLWLIGRRRDAIDVRHGSRAGWMLVFDGFVAHLLGASQQVVQAVVAAPLLAFAGTLALTGGWTALRAIALPLVGLALLVPMPGIVAQTLTLPLKIAVSQVAESILHALDYPVARAGVILAVDQYQLLVTDACAGLTSMFTLEAFGLLYMHLMGYTSKLRNVLVGILVIPCAFIANVVRVVVLVLVTYHLGNEAGQGFIHGFAGIVLFVVAFILLIGCDWLIGKWLAWRQPAAGAAA